MSQIHKSIKYLNIVISTYFNRKHDIQKILSCTGHKKSYKPPLHLLYHQIKIDLSLTDFFQLVIF